MPGPLALAYLILIDDLEAVVVDVFLVNEGNILGSTVVPAEHLHEVFLNLTGFFHDMLVGVGNGIVKELLPLAVAELVTVQRFQLTAQIGDEVGFLMNLQILIALLGEQLDKLPLQCRLTLVTVRAVLHRLVGGNNGVFSCGCHDIEKRHKITPLFSVPGKPVVCSGNIRTVCGGLRSQRAGRWLGRCRGRQTCRGWKRFQVASLKREQLLLIL